MQASLRTIYAKFIDRSTIRTKVTRSVMFSRFLPFPTAFVALILPLGAGVGAPIDAGGPLFGGQLTIRERIIIRVPKMRSSLPRGRMPVPVPPSWKEKRGPKCITATDLAGAMISQPGSVDLIMTGGARMRAVFDDDCGPLDYYGGYYLRPGSDGKICSSRDMIRLRSGGSCSIARFRRLVPAN